jgi:hypothetical protein
MHWADVGLTIPIKATLAEKEEEEALHFEII